MRAFIVSLLIQALSLLPASGAITIHGPALFPAAGGGLSAFSYNFTAADSAEWDAAKWTEISGSVNILTNTGRFVDAGFALAATNYTGGTCSTVNQYQKFIISATAAGVFQEVIFRYTNSTTPFYTISLNHPAGNVSWTRWATLADFAAGTPATTIHGEVTLGPASLVAGDVIAITVTGTGTSTIVNTWLDPTGDTPTSASVWGGAGPTVSFTDDPASPVNTGGVIGIAVFQSTGNSLRIDDWFGGDVP